MLLRVLLVEIEMGVELSRNSLQLFRDSRRASGVKPAYSIARE